jgi:adenosine deaminase
MDNLRKSIRLLFVDYCSDYILSKKDFNDFINVNSFIEKGFRTFSSYSVDEIQNVYYKLESDWFHDVHQEKNKNYFHILNHFTSKVLVEQDLEPFVVYEHLLKWRDLSYYIGEDILTTSFYACLDNRSQRKRDFFAWRPTAFSDNKRLHQLLKKGLAENHFHLKGSGPVFDLSWINIMNHPTSFEKAFEDLKKEISLLTKTSNASQSSKKELKILLYKAAYIRYELFRLVNKIDESKEFVIDISKESNSSASFDLLMNMQELSKNIEVLRYDLGHQFEYKGNVEIIDYTIPKNIHIQNLEKSYVFYGERKLLYECFKLIYSGDKEFQSSIYLFHSYLLIKAQFRAELIQVNDKVGFGNFSMYQDRKEFFLPDDSIYHTAFMNLAVHDTKSHSEIRSFELRVAPKEDVLKLKKSLEGYNKALDREAILSRQLVRSLSNIDNRFNLKEHNIFYTIHYIKKRDSRKYSDLSQEVLCRHHDLRIEIKKQSIAITQLREGYSEISDLIRGIDAASSEFNASPEVFAQGFRYLKNHKIKGYFNHLKDKLEEPKIYATYHAGEDFYDLVDGLRAIDESVRFLNLTQGDRIGHALALGIDVKEYYDFKQFKLMLPKQMVLDNIVWLLAKVRKFGIGIHRNEVNRLEKLYENLFYELYTANFDKGSLLEQKYIHHTTYFDAWKLRGDDPYLYLSDLNEDIYIKANLTYWERCRINEEYPKNKNIRNNVDIKCLYQQYHFNVKIKKAGAQIKQFEISYAYMELVEAVQFKMMHELKNKNIAIETNPTSNYLIGTFRRYAKHPITKFFNLGLELDHEKIRNCPQLSVSINTDDQGIFSTSLENEFALMAIALEKEKDENGDLKYNSSMIYEWLERVRLMGIGQSFNT